MRFLHTSDWHLGRSLYGQKRYEQFEAFLDWLLKVIEEENVDTLLICGDIFDTTLPSNRSQRLYYNFLSKNTASHTIIIGGNHDSPTFLEASKELLQAMNITVIGSARNDPEQEVITLYNEKGKAEAIIAAVPYLRDKDIRLVESGESADEKNRKITSGIREHYEQVCTIALNTREELMKNSGSYIPIIATGHLFTAGGKTTEDDGVRDLYVGSLAHINEQSFPDCIDYLALGHLHISQMVGGKEHFRYSGSPIPMGFGEADQTKKINIVSFEDSAMNIEQLSIPSFRKLLKIDGSLDEITQKIAEAAIDSPEAWIEIEYTKGEMIPDLREKIEEIMKNTSLSLLRIKNRVTMNRYLQQSQKAETLDELDVNEVFERLLHTTGFDEEEKKELRDSFKEIIISMQEDDTNAM